MHGVAAGAVHLLGLLGTGGDVRHCAEKDAQPQGRSSPRSSVPPRHLPGVTRAVCSPPPSFQPQNPTLPPPITQR